MRINGGGKRRGTEKRTGRRVALFFLELFFEVSGGWMSRVGRRVWCKGKLLVFLFLGGEGGGREKRERVGGK